jgi:UDP-4-amino-4,6-dideoxy-N-acetyl-beta-L-altrosamine transaminase
MKSIPYGRQHITDDDIRAVTETLKSDFLTQGPAIAEFENAFAAYCGSKYAVAVANGTAALHLCTMALGVKEDDNVITTPITFAASANCVRYCGGNVHFADIDPATYTLDIGKVEALIEAHPKGFFKGIIPVDFAGYAVNLEALRKLSDEHGLWIIEDACHAPGGFFTDSTGTKQICGNSVFADLAIFSFHPVKHIACGEGGMVTTNDEELYKKLVLLRTHGITKDPTLLHKNDGGWYYEMQELGYNYRLTDFQAALGTSQLKRADDGLAKRKKIAATYASAFKNKPYIQAQSGVVEGHAYHLYIIQVPKRKELYDYLRTKNIFCQVHYIPVHTMPYYKATGTQQTKLPQAESYYETCLSLPMFPTLTSEEQSYVINTIDEFYQRQNI